MSIILEWENAASTHGWRTLAMLRSLGRQIKQLLQKRLHEVEILAVTNELLASREDIYHCITSCLDLDRSDYTLRTVQETGLRYFQLKNRGAELASHEILLFLDTDVIPEPDWLERMLNAVSDPDVAACTGVTYMAPRNFYHKTFALFWFFPSGINSDKTVPANGIIANNAAFRKSVFCRFPYPDWPTHRGQGAGLHGRLTTAGIGVWKVQAARVEHPPPLWFRQFALRALREGHDRLYWQNKQAPLGHALRVVLQKYARGIKAIVKQRHKEAILRPVELPPAMAVVSLYYLFSLNGVLLSYFWRDWFRDRFIGE
ncbi:glycosyltransferase involved in cell wall biosynthesis [Methylohalomonas lacus]|uniref:Glycosyltransferase involved in cell wall biosynthesis n=1 Tax=Methylohalomonas lacus TaxID=398773 RepID=A0AAE3L2D9_9GAMM|nr:glycosyltransferase [Methylohalomonas lacus]MCS3904361.1 glycosyltransferase involved in cell wall biosynthesis [Methylohalomonas lacus]